MGKDVSGTCAIIIFLRKMELGKVKTRLAASTGAELALSIYKFLLLHTLTISRSLNVRKILFYHPEIEIHQGFEGDDFEYHIQSGQDLGERMINALRYAVKHFQKVVMIGTDCPYLKTTDLEDAFQSLEEHDVVVGPSTDGGYYLIGVKALNENLFKGVEWSTEQVLADTLEKVRDASLSVAQLRMLSDIDYEKDWLVYQEFVNKGI
ncbi:MAG: TIGR04282 family arsenosugar biosynthesis glycosyltransferase [Saprospiraceae bacterium]|nr:TIGR04282 family arsenosugar biosynthesis glycosyltransferase [Saprospiraceae bacterium]